MKTRFYCPACERKYKLKATRNHYSGALSAHCPEGHPLDEDDVVPKRRPLRALWRVISWPFRPRSEWCRVKSVHTPGKLNSSSNVIVRAEVEDTGENIEFTMANDLGLEPGDRFLLAQGHSRLLAFLDPRRSEVLRAAWWCAPKPWRWISAWQKRRGAMVYKAKDGTTFYLRPLTLAELPCNQAEDKAPIIIESSKEITPEEATMITKAFEDAYSGPHPAAVVLAPHLKVKRMAQGGVADGPVEAVIRGDRRPEPAMVPLKRTPIPPRIKIKVRCPDSTGAVCTPEDVARVKKILKNMEKAKPFEMSVEETEGTEEEMTEALREADLRVHGECFELDGKRIHPERVSFIGDRSLVDGEPVSGLKVEHAAPPPGEPYKIEKGETFTDGAGRPWKVVAGGAKFDYWGLFRKWALALQDIEEEEIIVPVASHPKFAMMKVRRFEGAPEAIGPVATPPEIEDKPVLSRFNPGAPIRYKGEPVVIDSIWGFSTGTEYHLTCARNGSPIHRKASAREMTEHAEPWPMNEPVPEWIDEYWKSQLTDKAECTYRIAPPWTPKVGEWVWLEGQDVDGADVGPAQMARDQCGTMEVSPRQNVYYSPLGDWIDSIRPLRLSEVETEEQAKQFIGRKGKYRNSTGELPGHFEIVGFVESRKGGNPWKLHWHDHGLGIADPIGCSGVSEDMTLFAEEE